MPNIVDTGGGTAPAQNATGTGAPDSGSFGSDVSQFLSNAGNKVNQYSANSGTTLPSYDKTGGSGSGSGGAISAQQALQDQLSWTNTIAEHYLGRDLSYRELLEVQKRGWNPEQLSQHIRAQGSYIPGLTIGQLEDYHTNSKTAFNDWLGREPTDEDIRDLHNRGIQDPQAIDEYIRNRPDVVALHPGAPLGMKDLEYHTAKNGIDSSYLQNLGRTANDEEARQGLTDRTKGPKPVQDEEVKPEFGQGSAGLQSSTMIAPNARSFA